MNAHRLNVNLFDFIAKQAAPKNAIALDAF